MLRSTAFCLAAIGIIAAAVVVHRGDTPDVAATQSLPAIAPADRGKLLARLADFAAGIDPLHALAAAFERAVARYAGVYIAASLPPQAFRARREAHAAAVVPIELQRAFRSVALSVWARNDPAGLLRYIETSDISAWTSVELVALRDAFAAEPARGREVVQRFPTPFRNIIEGR